MVYIFLGGKKKRKRKKRRRRLHEKGKVAHSLLFQTLEKKVYETYSSGVIFMHDRLSSFSIFARWLR